MELIRNDKQRLLLLLLQPFLVALLLNVMTGKQIFKLYEQTKSIIFALACSRIWIGMFNTIHEICKERVILKTGIHGKSASWSVHTPTIYLAISDLTGAWSDLVKQFFFFFFFLTRKRIVF